MLSIISKPRVLRKFLVYDMEWIPGILEIRCVGCFDGDVYRCYKSVYDFLCGEFTSKNRGKWFYAHAGGLADAQFILHEICKTLRTRGFKVRACFSGSSAIIIRVTRGKNAWVLIDSYWLLKDKLSKIAEWVGEKKGGGSFDDLPDPEQEGITDEEFERRIRAKREWYATVDFPTLKSYNEKDCVILWTAIYQFQVTLLEIGGQLQMTLASCSMQLFRRKYLTANIDTSRAVNETASKAYIASRVEMIQREVWDANYFDINSSFPYAMTQPCPGAYIGRRSGLPDHGIYIADVLIEVPDLRLTPTPIRLADRIFFPTGQWRQWLTSVDIESLRSVGGRVIKCYGSMLFEEFHDLRGFSEDLYSRRKNSSSEWEKTVLKFLLNSLYGKFAESENKQGLLIDPDNIDTETMMLLQPGIWLEEKMVPVPHVHVPISAHITALARKTLFDFMSSCSEVHYCDTDGFSTTDELPTSKELGGLKLEKIVHHGEFVTQKVYSIEGKILQSDGSWKETSYYKAKGFSRVTNASRFARIMEGEAIECERMRRVREVMRSGDSKPREHTIRKRLNLKSIYAASFDYKKNTIPKRMPYPDGKTRPWRVEELKGMIK